MPVHQRSSLLSRLAAVAIPAIGAGCHDLDPTVLALQLQPVCRALPAAPSCGDPCGEGVVVESDIEDNTQWDCPVYTLARPIFVRSRTESPARLVIGPGTVIRGRRGDSDAGTLPGALVVTRSAQIDARGTATTPVVFTSSTAEGERAAGDWGGVALLGRAPVDTPADFQSRGNVPGEFFLEGLPPSADTTYGAAVEGVGAVADPEHSCGRLAYVRIEFSGFALSETNELNGLTLAGCGRGTVLDYIQVHRGADDGIEFFGGTANLRHAVLTGNEDDSLDWGQGWTGRAQFVLVAPVLGGDANADSILEGDGFSDVDNRSGTGSAPVLYNVTALNGGVERGLRLRTGTALEVGNSIFSMGNLSEQPGLLELGDALTVDQVTSSRIRIHHSIFQGQWVLAAPPDSTNAALAPDPFASLASFDNTALSSSDLPGLFDDPQAARLPGEPPPPAWTPVQGSWPSQAWALPEGDDAGFFDGSATYRGGIDPGGPDWTQGWTSYPAN